MFVDNFQNFEQFIGSEHNDSFQGSSDVEATEWFEGGYGDDVFCASLGQDNFSDVRIGFDGGFDTVDYSRLEGSIRFNADTDFVSVRDANGSEISVHRIRDSIEKVAGTDSHDILAGNRFDNHFDGGRGSDVLTGRGGSDVFIFDGSKGDIGFDRVTDFEAFEDDLMLKNLHLTNGREVAGFGDLDSNGDGALNTDDANMFGFADKTVLLFAEGYVQLDDVPILHESDLLFA
ncbi:hypothetical protein Q5Y75_21415 [Ruegeria sp. 2205SS24-7]|uniref:hypothetical protein n=1 Tax=Ruegeria discodermiae TaxID=3064389 RepID=UPI0027418FCA|nr:hypothetical protein [Ruegeria sp. 2205SS24-7]MDP5219789.1 hypothetical protein [Ruegeria sp. 2205SS24-7]